MVGGGPSLKGFDYGQLAGLNVIAINRALEVCPSAPVLWWSDVDFWKASSAKIRAHSAQIKATGHLDYPAEDLAACEAASVAVYRFSGLTGFDPDPARLRHGNNSGYAALHLAAHLGARLVILLGVDMRHGPGGASHWHDGHGRLHRERSLKDLMLPYFPSIAGALVDRGVTVLNASPDSALMVWPRCSIQKGLEAYGRAISESIVGG